MSLKLRESREYMHHLDLYIQMNYKHSENLLDIYSNPKRINSILQTHKE